MIKVAIWGCGELGERLLHVINTAEIDIEVIAFIDTDYMKEGTTVTDKNVISPSTFQEKYKHKEIEYIFVPAYPYIGQIIGFIDEMGIPRDNIYIADDHCLHELIIKYGSFEKTLQRRTKKIPFLLSLEYEVSHHCNLNCKGCNHFAPLQREPKLGDLKSFENDLRRISEFVEYIETIKLLGGEPLLNPQLDQFIIKTFEVFPNTSVHIITNGIAISKMSEKLIETIKQTNTTLSITVYPPMKQEFIHIKEFMINRDIPYEIFYEANKFFSQINSKGDSNLEKAEKNCDAAYCHIFGDGKISKCSITHKIPVYNKAYGTSLPQCSIDLYKDDLSAKKLYEYFTHPIEMCRYCGQPRWYSWKHAQENPQQEDYECRCKFV